MSRTDLLNQLNYAHNLIQEYNTCDKRFQNGLKNIGADRSYVNLPTGLASLAIPFMLYFKLIKNTFQKIVYTHKLMRASASQTDHLPFARAFMYQFAYNFTKDGMIETIECFKSLCSFILTMIVSVIIFTMLSLVHPIVIILLYVGFIVGYNKLISTQNANIDNYNYDLAQQRINYVQTSKDYARILVLQQEFKQNVLSWLPPQYGYLQAIKAFIGYINAQRADSLKEVINLFEQDKHFNKLHQGQQALYAQSIANTDYLSKHISQEAMRTRQHASNEAYNTRQHASNEAAATRANASREAAASRANISRESEKSRANTDWAVKEIRRK